MSMLGYLYDYRGSDDDDGIPINRESINHMESILDFCIDNSLPLPEVFPWYGGDGVQAEWRTEDNWYLEIDSSSEGISGLFVKDQDYESSIECNFETIKSACNMIKIMLKPLASTSKS